MSLVVTVPTDRLAESLRPLPDSVELHVWDLKTPAPANRIDIVVPPYMSMSSALAALEGVSVGLIQGQSIGYDGVAEVLPAGIPFANAASVHETSTAEMALTLALAAQRQLPQFVRAQDAATWSPVFAESLADRRALLVGFGGVGKAIARRLVPFEVEVTALARTARVEHVEGLGDVDVHGLDDLPALLVRAEIVFISLPGGDETHHMFNAEVLAHMADGALLVNVGRGTLVDSEALLVELNAGRLRAASDVWDPEPLPADHPLWKAPNVLIAPHVGGATTAMNPRVAKLIRTQIDRALAGQEPINVVLG